MEHSELLRKARQAFQGGLADPPAATLLGAHAVRGDELPEPDRAIRSFGLVTPAGGG